MTTPQNPAEGQFFTLQPVLPPEPQARNHWGLPLALGLLAIPLLMFGFGFSQQQAVPTPSVSPNASATPETLPSPVASAATEPSPSATPIATPERQSSPVATTPQLAPLIDSANLPAVAIRATNVAINFRAAPSLHSQVLGVLMFGDLVQLTLDRRVNQDGVTWVPVRWRGQTGWIAANFIGGQSHASF